MSNSRLTEGGGVVTTLHNVFYILCSHFDENKVRWTTLPGGRVSRQSQRVRDEGWANIRNHYFEKYLHSMVLNLTLYIRYIISFFYKAKNPVKCRHLELFWWRIQFCPIFHWKPPNWAKSALMALLWRHTRNICTFLGETHSCRMIPNNHTSGVYFSSW